VQGTLVQAGLLINSDKSIFQPTQRLEWLGLMWDSHTFSLSIPQRRIADTNDSILFLIDRFPNFTARELARAAGKIISMSPVIGNVSSLMTRHLYLAIESRIQWDCCLSLLFPEAVKLELQFWTQNLSVLNHKSFVQDSLPVTLVFSDASDIAAGAFTVEFNEKVFHKAWSKYESMMSSTWRELKAVQLALESFGSSFVGKSLLWHTDNQNCVTIIQKGSTKVHLQELAFSIFSNCLKYSISFNISWIPRKENVKADYISNIVDYEDWQTTVEFFNFIDEIWGPHTVDRFASVSNSKLRRFNSLFWYPEYEAVDAFTQNWRFENNWLVPPICLVNRAIKHMIMCKGVGTLIIPKWPSGAFWTLLFDKNMKYRQCVVDVLEFEPNQRIFKHGLNTNSIFGSDRFDSRVLAVRLCAVENK
jgi:hypothetical protein